MNDSKRQPIDFALAEHRDRWLHHPVLGDPSWDAFEREPGNPIYTGRAPYPWPVNGFLFRDPPSGRWYAFVGLYLRGYWPPDRGGARGLAECLVMREQPGGGWEELGCAVPLDRNGLDGDGKEVGGIPDVSVVYADGRYHMVYDWCNPDNSRGGLGYAWSEGPEGPYVREKRPVHDDSLQEPLARRYVRAYAGTLFKRENDWLVLCMMSTPHNAGGTWAHAALTAKSPEGPYSAPTLLAFPQSDVFHPQLAEFYPAFVHDGFAYAPATSVAANRAFQTIFRAPVEDAHRPDAWSVHQLGSAWHAEPVSSEAAGLWGQTFSGQVAPDGTLRAFFPCKTAGDVGTIGIARRQWSEPFRDGFRLSAPNAPAAAVLRGTYGDFQLKAAVQATGPWALAWDCRGPLGQDRIGADAVPHALWRTSRREFRRDAENWEVVELDGDGSARQLASGSRAAPEVLEVERAGRSGRIRLMGKELWSGELPPENAGRLELVAEKGTLLHVEEFEVAGRAEAARESWLALDALSGAAEPPGNWREEKSGGFRWGVGYASASDSARAKWNFTGRGFRLWSPRGPGYGRCEVLVDGRPAAKLDLASPADEPSAVVLESELPAGNHAVVLRALQGAIPCDSLEVMA